MAKIFPFRGIRYDPEKVGEIAEVVSLPYDKINPELQAAYYERHPRNIVRLIKGKTSPNDSPENDQYTRARNHLNQWIEDGTLRRDEDPALYVYDEEYQLPSGERRVRRGLIALAELEDLGKGGIMAHEKTLAGPKADRLNLMRATGCQFGQIFMLYSDPENKINHLLDRATAAPPVYEFEDSSEGSPIKHRLWKVSDPKIIDGVVREMAEKPLFIADGHHRYETALNYRNEMRAAARECAEGSENYTNRMMTFVNFADEGLTIFPTHRVIHSLSDIDWASFFTRLKDDFTIEETTSLPDLLARMKEGEGAPTFGLYGDGKYFLLKLKPGQLPEEIIRVPKSDAWKKLDVTVLHTLILDALLGIDAARLEAHSNVRYYRSAEEAHRLVKEGAAQMVFFLNPTRASQVREVAEEGEKMPQKSTDFFPKVLTGLVINKIALK